MPWIFLAFKDDRHCVCYSLHTYGWGVIHSGEDFRGKPRGDVIESCDGIITIPSVAS